MSRFSQQKQKKILAFLLIIVCLQIFQLSQGLAKSYYSEKIEKTTISPLSFENLDTNEIIMVEGKTKNLEGLRTLRYLSELNYTLLQVTDCIQAGTILQKKHLFFLRDQEMSAQLLDSQELMGIKPEYQFEKGNYSVCIMDTGVNIHHSMFNEEQLLHWQDFVGKNRSILGDNYDEPIDSNGHGTAISSVIVGKESSSLSYQLIETCNQTLYSNTVDGLKLKKNENASITIYNLENAITNISFIEFFRNGTEFVHPLKTNWIFTTEENITYSSSIDNSRYGLFKITARKIVEQEPISINATVVCDRYLTFHGVVPESNFVLLKVLDDEGIGTTSAFFSACDYLLSIKEEYNITVVNMAFDWGGQYIPAVDDVVDTLCENGLCVVVPAGNRGPAVRIGSPGMSEKALTVGAHNVYYQVTKYSSRGDLDILAPGGSMYINESRGVPENQQISCANNSYENGLTSMKGTSLSCSFIAGVALAKSNSYSWQWKWQDAARLKNAILMSTFETWKFGYEYDPIMRPYLEAKDTGFWKDEAEGFGSYYYVQEEEISFDPRIEENISFSCTVGMKSQPVHIFKLKTWPNVDYLLSWSCTKSCYVGVFSEEPVEDVWEPNLQGFSGYPNDELYFVGWTNVFIVVRSLDPASTVTLSVKQHPLGGYCWLVSPELEEKTRNQEDLSITINFSNGFITVKLDNESIEQYQTCPGNYYIPSIKDGDHRLDVYYIGASFNKHIIHSWRNDIHSPNITCSVPNNYEIGEQTTILFNCSDFSELAKFIISINDVLFFNRSIGGNVYLYPLKLNPTEYVNQSFVDITVVVYDECWNRATFDIRIIFGQEQKQGMEIGKILLVTLLPLSLVIALSLVFKKIITKKLGGK